jgi:ATP-binding cassette subfamily B protein
MAAPPPITLRRTPALLGRALRLAWAAAPGELLLAVVLQGVGGLGLVLPIVAGRDLLGDVMTPGTTDRPAVVLQGAVVLGLLGLLGLAGAVGLGRDEILGELINRHAQRRILDVACSADLEDFERPAFHDRLARAAQNAGMRAHQLAQALVALVQAAMAAIGVLVAVTAVEPVLGLATLLVGLPLWAAGVRSGQVTFAMVLQLTSVERGPCGPGCGSRWPPGWSAARPSGPCSAWWSCWSRPGG